MPEWREGYGPLQIAAGVTMVGEEGAVLSGGHAGLAVEAEGVRFESLHLPRGVRVKCLGSLKMVKCTATGRQVAVEEKTSLVMEDTRVYGGGRDEDGGDVVCRGTMKLTRCTVEESYDIGVYVSGERAEAELIDCVIRKHERDGLVATGGAKVTLRGGTVSGNKRDGVVASGEGVKITVSKEQPTICKDNERHDWLSEDGGVLEGVAEENARG